MPVIKLNQDGSVSGTRSKEEIIAYYNGLIERRACAMRSWRPNNEKKRKLSEV